MSTTAARDAPDASAPVERASPKTVALRAGRTFMAHGMTDHAAGLTYYAMMSLFPGLLTAVSLLSIFGQASLARDAAQYVVDNGASADTAGVIQESLNTLFSANSGAIGVALVVSILLGLNGASGAFGAAGRALNVVHAVDEDRSFVRRKVNDIASTLVVILLFGVMLVCLALGGGIAEDVLGTIGLGSTGTFIWSIGRWFVALAVMLAAFGVVYARAPDVHARFRWVTPGAVAAVVIWVVASLLFAVYLQNFSSYGAAYGAFGAAIALLLWLYISANAFLLGGELNMAVEREETAGRGGPPMVSPPPSAAAPVPTAVAPRSAASPDPNQTSGGPGERSSG